MTDDQKKAAFEAWLNDPERRDNVRLQRAAKTCPPWNVYVIRSGAPYSITRPGAIGRVHSYTDNGEVGFVMLRPGPGPMWNGMTGVNIQDPPRALKAFVKPEHLRRATREEAAKVQPVTEEKSWQG